MRKKLINITWCGKYVGDQNEFSLQYVAVGGEVSKRVQQVIARSKLETRTLRNCNETHSNWLQ